MSNKRILPSIGLEGTKEELLEFLSDFDINKISISLIWFSQHRFQWMRNLWKYMNKLMESHKLNEKGL